MLALKKKREAERKEAEEAKNNAAKAAASGEATAPAAPGGTVSLFGIGGEKKTKKGEGPGKKRSPGEIRIQKGEFLYSFMRRDFIVVRVCRIQMFDTPHGTNKTPSCCFDH